MVIYGHMESYNCMLAVWTSILRVAESRKRFLRVEHAVNAFLRYPLFDGAKTLLDRISLSLSLFHFINKHVTHITKPVTRITKQVTVITRPVTHITKHATHITKHATFRGPFGPNFNECNAIPRKRTCLKFQI